MLPLPLKLLTSLLTQTIPAPVHPFPGMYTQQFLWRSFGCLSHTGLLYSHTACSRDEEDQLCFHVSVTRGDELVSFSRDKSGTFNLTFDVSIFFVNRAHWMLSVFLIMSLSFPVLQQSTIMIPVASTSCVYRWGTRCTYLRNWKVSEAEHTTGSNTSLFSISLQAGAAA